MWSKSISYKVPTFSFTQLEWTGNFTARKSSFSPRHDWLSSKITSSLQPSKTKCWYFISYRLAAHFKELLLKDREKWLVTTFNVQRISACRISNVLILELLSPVTSMLLSVSCLAFLEKNMTSDWDFPRLEISECFLAAIWLVKAGTPVLEISEFLLQRSQWAFQLLSLFSIHSVNQSSTSQLSLKIHLSFFVLNILIN